MKLRTISALLLLAMTFLVVHSQDSPADKPADPPTWKLAAVTDPMGQTFPIAPGPRGLLPGVESFGSPYLLQNKTDGLALWYVHGGRAYPVSFEGGKRPMRKSAPQIVRSGGLWLLTYIDEGVNEFWALDAEQAVQIKHADGKPFSQRSHITRGGDKPVLYQGSYDGKTSLFIIRDNTATPVTISDKADHGTAQYAWSFGARLLVAMYMAGTHDFYWFEDGKFTPCWERNGTEEYDDQIESIYAKWHRERLFLNLLRRDGKGELWTLRDDKLVALTDPAKLGVLDWFDGGNAAVGRDGLCFVATAKDTRKLYVSDGLETNLVKAPDGHDLSLDDDCELAGVGGGVIATSEGFDQFRSWLITGGTATLLGTHKRGSVAVYRCVAAAGNADLVRQCNEQGETSWQIWRDGKSANADIKDWPESAGNVFSAWTLTEDGKSVAYFIERPTAQGSKFRLWSLTNE